MNRRFLKFISIITVTTLLSLSLAASVFASYPSHTDFVSDGAVILDEKAESDIISASEKLYETKGVRIAVCTVLNTGNEDIEDFGSKLFTKWKINDGVLILLSIEEDNFYAVQSNSLSEYLPASDLKNILNSNLEPAFAIKEYSDGTTKTVNALSNHLSNKLPDDFAKSGAAIPGWAVAIIVIIIVIAVIAGGIYAAIIFIRRKNIRKRREEMELRRRRLAEGRGREMYQARAASPAMRDNRQRVPMPQGARPMPQGARPMPQGTRPMPQQGGNNMPRSQVNVPMTPQRRPAQPQAQRPNPANAATVQINTSDIRAAKQNKRP